MCDQRKGLVAPASAGGAEGVVVMALHKRKYREQKGSKFAAKSAPSGMANYYVNTLGYAHRSLLPATPYLAS